MYMVMDCMDQNTLMVNPTNNNPFIDYILFNSCRMGMSVNSLDINRVIDCFLD